MPLSSVTQTLVDKTCTRCGETKALSSFHRDRTRRDGYSPSCIECRRGSRSRTAESIKRERLRSNYGISLEDYERMLIAQNHVCAICRKPEIRTNCHTGKTQMLSVDHCHKTGRVRGLLCANCNQGIGLLQDDPELLVRAIDYLS